MEKKFFAAKRGNVFRRKSDGVVIGRFVIDTAIDGYEEVVDERPIDRRHPHDRREEILARRKNPHRPSRRR